MIVMLIGKNVIYKTKLPKIPMGNYWINGKNEQKLINIEGKGGGWQITSNNHVKIINPESIASLNVSKTAENPSNIVSKVLLKEYSMNYIYLKDLSDNFFVLYCVPTFENNFIHLNRKNSQEILIGSGESNDILYRNPFVQQKHARIFYSNGKLMLENFDDTFGTFVNNNPVTKRLKLLFNGDVIFIMGLKIIIIGKSIYINNPFNQVNYNRKIFEVNITENQMLEFAEEDDTNVELYSEKDYFARAPKITNIIEREKIKIDKPPENQNREGLPLIYLIGSTLGMGIIMLISTLSTIDQLLNVNS